VDEVKNKENCRRQTGDAASDTDDHDKFIRCAKQESQIPFARHSVITADRRGRAGAARRKLEEQEDLHIQQQTVEQNQAYESERRRKERQERDSIMLMADQQIKLQQMAEQYMESEAKCRKDYEICVGVLRKNMASREKALTLEEQEDISIPLVQALTSLHKTAMTTHQVHQSAPPAGPAPSSKPAEDRGSRVPGGVVVEARATDAREGKEDEEEEDMVALDTKFSPDSGEQVLSRCRMRMHLQPPYLYV
jgi:hypothetical protein